ncbi:C6 finger domain-containing protein [Colletotrichum kahawae]|uniref:C6 finger domain-containing protein n=1 Tax=Colletotrichum kahawae TaxID=34407 RepID=A0AAD9Y1A1_COLKA|nr:C6 finger domain-containing protein [Colletotrichum kahawae]
MMRMPAAPVIVAAASPNAAVATSAAADCRPTAAAAATASPVNVLHDAASDGSEPYSSYSSSPFMSVRRVTNNTGTNDAAATNTNSTNGSTSIGTNSANANTSTSASVEPRHPTHRRLAPAPPPPPPPTAANSRHPDALRFPPSPSPTPSHPTLTSSSSNYSNASHPASERPSCRPPAPKPGQCPVMALQNVLCDDDVDAAAADVTRRTASRPSQPPTPPVMHDVSVSILPVPVPHPAASHVLPPGPMPSSLTLNPILSGHDAPDPMIVARPNPSHVVMTARPQLQPRVQPTDPGCKTCQVRKMPCDESRPTCLNCSRMGINCLGYHDSPPSHVQMTQPSDRPVPGPSVASNTSTPNGNASASRQEQEEYLYYLLDHYRHTKRHCMWDLITLDFNEHFQAKMRKEALQMIKRRRFKDRETREPSPNEPTTVGGQLPPRPRQKKRGPRPKFSPTIPPNMRESGTESGTG